MSLATTRRRMLALTAAFPALHFLRRFDARAAGKEGAAPRRFLLIYHALGSYGQKWYGGARSETDFDLGPTLSPLQPLKKDLVICRNVDNKPACEFWFNAPPYCKTSGGKNDQHSVASATILSPTRTRIPNEGFTYPGMETLDWHIGRQLQKAAGVPYDNVFITPASRHSVSDGVNVFSTRRNAGGQLEDPPVEDNPVAIYEKYFAKKAGGLNTSGMDPAEADRLQRRALARKRVTDFVAREVTAYQKALPSDLRYEVEPHVAELRALESTLAGAQPGNEKPVATPEQAICSTIAPPDAALVRPKQSNYRARAEVIGDIAAALFACDMTRAITLSWYTYSGACYPPNLAGTKTYPILHEGLQHLMYGYKPQDSADCHQHLAHQTNRVLQKLKSMPEGDGTMLDNTVVLWISELGMDPWANGHNKINLPFVLAGGRNCGLTTGRMIDFQNMSHARLFSAITHLVGVPTDAFGDAKYNTGGPAPQLLA